MDTTHPEHDALADLLCFDLYAASRAVTAAYRPLLAELDLTYPQYLVLVLLHERPTRTVKELVAALRLDHGTLTPLLQRMQTAGLLTRIRSADDERVVEVTLSARGESLRARFDDVRCEIRRVMDLSETQARDLQTALRSLAAQVSDR